MAFEKEKLYCFDFDGTLTTRDTLLEFIRYAVGTWRLLIGFLLYSPLLVMMKLGLYPNYKAKQRVFSYFFRGMPIERFDSLCQGFANDCQHLVRQKSIETLREIIIKDTRVHIYIVSASIDNWVSPFIHQMLAGIRQSAGDDEACPGVTVLGTQIETEASIVTGRFLSKNCYGPEKVSRITEQMNKDGLSRDSVEMIAYGDSRGDKEMLEYADEGYLLKHGIPNKCK